MNYETACKAYASFQKLKFFWQQEKNTLSSEDYGIFRDALMKRYALAIETMFQCLKTHLNLKQRTSLKTLLKICLEKNIISHDELTLLKKIILDRKRIRYAYKEHIAQAALVSLMKQSSFLNEIIKKVQP